MSANDATMSAKGRCASSRAAAPKFAGPIPAYCLPHGPLLPNLPGRSRPTVSLMCRCSQICRADPGSAKEATIRAKGRNHERQRTQP